jgi:hypothetical protein
LELIDVEAIGGAGLLGRLPEVLMMMAPIKWAGSSPMPDKSTMRGLPVAMMDLISMVEVDPPS